MDSLRRPSTSSLSLFLLVLIPISVAGTGAGGVFRVQRKFVGGEHSIADLKNHDANRHGRFLSTANVDVPLGGNGLPTAIGLYFTEIGIGTPPNNFSVQVDTGSDIMWVNCAPCDGCPKKSILGIELTPYDPKHSSTARELACEGSFCSTLSEEHAKCPSSANCKYMAKYADGSSASGYFVTDLVNYNQVTGDHQTQGANANVTFGCAVQQTGTSSIGIEGLIGFGQANSSTISQLASSGKVRKIFAHCLDTIKGGGIFAIGNVVQPKVDTTPLIPNMPHYNVNMTSIEVGSKRLILPKDVFETDEDRGTIIDSGTTLAYIPDIAYIRLMDEIFANHKNVEKYTTKDKFTCFSYSGSVDDGFPVVTFHFEMLVNLQVKPHDYFFKNKDDWCVGWQNSGAQYKFLLGDMTISNKLVIYDLENQSIGWTDYDCSTNIKVEEDQSKAVHIVDAHALPSSTIRLEMERGILSLSLAFLLCLLNLLS